MNKVDAVFLTGLIIVLLLLVGSALHQSGRASVRDDCVRDGFTWIYGVRFDCQKTKTEGHRQGGGK